MTDTDDDLIRRRAYEIWESEGFPEGREYAHWEQAVRELSEQSAAEDSGAKPVQAPFSIVQNDAPVEAVAKKRGKAVS